MLDLEKLLELENVMQVTINQIKSYENFVYYGLGYNLISNFDNYTGWLGKPAYIIDKNSDIGNVFHGIPVVTSLAEVSEKLGIEFCVVITAPTYRREIAYECEKYLPKRAIYEHLVPLSQNNCHYNEFVMNNRESIMTLYNALADEKSKITLENQLAGKLTNDLRYFVEVCIPNRASNTQQLAESEICFPMKFMDEQRVYFPNDIFDLTEDEVFIDCGAYDGDTFMDFVAEINGKYKAAICLELDPANYIQLKNNVKNYNNVHCLNVGVWSEAGKMKVALAASEASSISINKNSKDKNSQTVFLKRLDDIVSELNVKPTFIKMDIEGAELMALKGAEHVIRTYKPKLAVCVYHKDQDIVEIPSFMKELNPDYKFYLRKYSISADELILYAI